MASFLDQRYQFAPYVETTPVDAMVKVGMYKQQQYDAGVQKINDWIDQTAALPVMREVDKQYLQSSLNNLTSELKKVAGADFSNQQLVQSVGGATKRLAQDPNIVAALYSTKNHQDNLQLMEEARQKGELTPDNKYNYTKALDAYYNSNELGQKFSAKYTPWFDVDKYTRETFNALKPNNLTYDEVFVTDSQGKPVRDANGTPIYNPVMKRLKKEGLFPETVNAALNQIMSDPRVSRQLNITGEYNYRNYTPQQLQGLVTSERDNVIAAYEDRLRGLTLRKTLGENVDAEFEEVDSKLEKARYSYEEYRNLALTNPEAVAGKLYKDGVENRYTKMYGRVNIEETVHDNPGYIREFERLKEANNQYWKAKEFSFNVQKHQDDLEMKRAELLLKAQGEGTGGKKTSKTLKPGDPGYVPETFQADQSAVLDMNLLFDKNYNEAATNDVLATNNFIWEGSFAQNAKNQDLLTKLMSGPNGMSKDDAIQKILNDTAALTKESPEQFRARYALKTQQQIQKAANKIPPVLADAYQSFISNKRIFDNEVAFKKNRLDNIQEGGYTQEDIEKMTTLDIKPETIYMPGGFMGEATPVTLDKQDIIDLALYKKAYMATGGIGEDANVKSRANEAKARILSKHKDTGEWLLQQLMTPTVSDYLRTPGSSALRSAYDFLKPVIFPASKEPVTPRALALNLPSSIDKVYDMLTDVNYSKVLKKRAEAIHQHYRIQPNQAINLLTGNAEADRSIITDLRAFAGQATEGQKMNEAPNFNNFATALAKNNIALQAKIIVESGTPKVKINAYGESGTLEGDMYLTLEQAKAFNIDAENLYEPREISSLRSFIDNMGNNQTAKGIITDKQTYTNDAYFVENDFPNLKGSPYKAKANILYSKGKYFPYVYVQDARGRSIIKALDGDENLSKVVSGMKDALTPQFAEIVLIGK